MARATIVSPTPQPRSLWAPFWENTNKQRISYRSVRNRHRLGLETLEDRRMLANVTVSNLTDIVNGNTSSINALIGFDGGDGISLREAIVATNNTAGADIIGFIPALSGGTISLGGTELAISDALTIDATPLNLGITIHANQFSRIFNITATTGDFGFAGLTLTGGRTTGNNVGWEDSTFSGGAIRSASTGALTVDRSTVSGNSTIGTEADGGGIFARGDLTVTDSTFSGNSTAGDLAQGGGIYAWNTMLTRTTVSGNHTTGVRAGGGGVYAGGVTLDQSTVSGNSTAGNESYGGGIYSSVGAVTLTESTVSGNSTTGISAHGGGIFAGDAVTLTDSAVSANTTTGFSAAAGGIWANGAVMLTVSTVNGNSTTGNNAGGGGMVSHGAVTLNQSTVSSNSTTGSNSRGGGIYAYDAVTLIQSTVIGNSTSSGSAYGGGIFGNGNVTLTASTVSGNLALSYGGIIGQTVTLNQSTVSENIGGGVFAQNAVLERSTVSQNTGIGGVAATGDVLVLRSTIRGNSFSGQGAAGSYGGGGIRAGGNVWLEDSTVSGNRTNGLGASGGGIRALGAVTAIRSTINDNRTTGGSAGGGGIFALGTVALTKSTVSGNSSTGEFSWGAGIMGAFSSGSVTLTQSTVTQNHVGRYGGGVHVGSTSTIVFSGSIVAGNTAVVGGNDLFAPNSTLTANFSLIGTGITPNSGGSNVVTNNPLLGPLSDNGGSTQTHAPLPNSPAINAGDPTIAFHPTEYDQRGAPFVRVFGGRIDIGAHERQIVTGLNLVVNNLSDVVDGDYSAGNLSLREAVGLANGSVGVDTITFAAALSGQTITLGGTEMVITDALTIDATALAQNVTIDANQSSRVFHIVSGVGNVTLAGLTMTGGRTTATSFAGDGGAVRSLSAGQLTLNRCVVSGNSLLGSNAWGGGIYSFGPLVLTGSTVTGNTSTFGSGGGILAGSTAMLTDSTVSNNTSLGAGGGISALYDVQLNQSTVSGNQTTGNSTYGGGIFSNGVITLNETTVISNIGLGNSSRGGGIFSAEHLLITASVISGNSARDGGGIASDGPATIVDTTISHNSALYGGGISHNSGNLTIERSTFSSNTAFQGGGLLTETTLGVNQTTILNSTFSGNTGTGFGGGVFNSSGSLIVQHSTFTNNNALANLGAGIASRVANSQVQVQSSIVAGNLTGGDVQFVDGVSNPFTSLGYNLIGLGNAQGAFGQPGDQTGVVNPGLGSLAHNGGPTQTHALQSGSPAVNAGNPSIVFNPNEFDQRGAPFARVADGRIDIGAFELQTITPTSDFNNDGVLDLEDIDALVMEIASGNHNPLFDLTGDGLVNLADRDVWLAVAGAANLPSGNPYLLGDANLDGVVDGSDFGIWNANKFTVVARWSRGDFNADGMVDGSDFSNWNANKFTASDSGVPQVTRLPESDATMITSISMRTAHHEIERCRQRTALDQALEQLYSLDESRWLGDRPALWDGVRRST